MYEKNKILSTDLITDQCVCHWRRVNAPASKFFVRAIEIFSSSVIICLMGSHGSQSAHVVPVVTTAGHLVPKHKQLSGIFCRFFLLLLIKNSTVLSGTTVPALLQCPETRIIAIQHAHKRLLVDPIMCTNVPYGPYMCTIWE
jgi:hypothetical protein